MWLEIDNLSQIPQKNDSRLLTSSGGIQQRSYTARTWITKRGAYPLGPTMLTSGDPFGIFACTRLDPAKNTLIVLPLTVDIPYFPAPEGILPGGKEVHQKTMDVPHHATGVKEYVPGDPIKRVHWQSTAKREHFMVKKIMSRILKQRSVSSLIRKRKLNLRGWKVKVRQGKIIHILIDGLK